LKKTVNKEIKELNFYNDDTGTYKVTSKPIIQTLLTALIYSIFEKIPTLKLSKNKKQKLLRLAIKFESIENDIKNCIKTNKNLLNFSRDIEEIYEELALIINNNLLVDEAMNSAVKIIYDLTKNDETLDKETLTKQQLKDGL